jgi:hypothetical protein
LIVDLQELRLGLAGKHLARPSVKLMNWQWKRIFPWQDGLLKLTTGLWSLDGSLQRTTKSTHVAYGVLDSCLIETELQLYGNIFMNLFLRKSIKELGSV